MRGSLPKPLLSTGLALLLAVTALTGAGNLAACTSPEDPPRPNLDATTFDQPVDTSADGQPVAAEEERRPEGKHALISFTGDCTLSSTQEASGFESTYEAHGPGYFFDGVRHVFEADDLTVVNLEGPLTTSAAAVEKGEPPTFWFRSPPEYVQILVEGGVELCNLANNHTLDYGYEGYRETQEVLAGAGIDYYAYDDVWLDDVNGIMVGIFGFAFDSNAYNIQQMVYQLREAGAEVVVATFHEGLTEVTYEPTGAQREAAYAAIDAGADAVVEHHPHVLQGIEEYMGKVIAYSLGNFCYGGHTNPADKDTMILQLDIAKGDDGSIAVSHTVISCSISSSDDYNDYRPRVYEREEAARVLARIEEMSAELYY
jgi:poly-gamma-glutamate synthesis protein (capsule biosynthesis protein)